MWIPFYKSTDLVTEELRIQEFRDLLNKGLISPVEFINAVKGIKQVGEGSISQEPSVLGTVQLLIILGLVGAGIYIIRSFRT